MSGPFQRVTPAHLERLRALLGADVVSTGADDLQKYAHDETEDFKFPPEVVLKPATPAQVSAILSLCNAERIPVTPRGAGTGLSGGALPVFGGVSLSLERFNRILEIDDRNLMATVEPGVITQVFQETVEKQGLFYPPDPASRGSCMLGGNIAHNAGGPRALKYGVTKDYVYGLEAVLPSGEIIRTGGKLYKNVAGYNLTQLLVGSEGTLAVVTKIILKLLPLPPYRKTLLAPFDDLEVAAHAVAQIFRRKVIPCALEFMEGGAVRVAEERKGVKFPHSNAAALLLVDVDGHDESQVEREAETVGEVFLDEGARDIFLAETREKQNFLWDVRRSIGEAVKRISPYREEDCVVPRSRLPELVRAVKAACKRQGLDALCYGHVGDGNLHVNILKRALPDAEWRRVLPLAVQEIFEATVKLGGTLSGEHGIGYVQKDYMPLALGPAELGLLRQIKAVFDPNGILNPGKMLPDPSPSGNA